MVWQQFVDILPQCAVACALQITCMRVKAKETIVMGFVYVLLLKFVDVHRRALD